MGLGSSQKGISEIISALLVITITISAGTLFAVYASGTLGRIETQATSQPYLDQLTLEYYNWPIVSAPGGCTSSSATDLCMTVRNDGASNIIFVDYFMQGVRNTSDVKPTSCSTLTVQSSCNLDFPVPTGLTSTISGGTAYTIKLVAKDGTLFTFSCVYGSYTH
jgi:flagellin-like protein